MRRIPCVTAVPILPISSRQQPIEYEGVATPSATNPKASYTDRKPVLLILCGSVYS